MNRFIERALNEPFAGRTFPETIGWIPAMDIVETPKEFALTAELPGMELKDITVNVEDGVLAITGEKTEEKKEEEDKKVYLERSRCRPESTPPRSTPSSARAC
jgi:HSP20 family protein